VSPTTGRTLGVITSSPALTGGVRAQMQINETIAASGGRLLARPQSVVPRAHEKMKDGEFVHAETLAFLLEGVRDLVAEIRVARGDDSLVPARPYADPTDIRRTS
jgi:chromate reductase